MQTAKMTSICSRCGAKYPENGLPYCLKCRVEMSERIMASTIMTPIMTTIMTPTIKDVNVTKKVGWLRSAVRFINTYLNRLSKKREEERDNEMLIRKAGARE